MSAQDWVTIIQAVGVAVTAVFVAVIPLLIRELRANTVATQQSTQATQTRNVMAAAEAPSADPLATLAALQRIIEEATTPKPVA